jgi:hypothetical protein
MEILMLGHGRRASIGVVHFGSECRVSLHFGVPATTDHPVCLGDDRQNIIGAHYTPLRAIVKTFQMSPHLARSMAAEVDY